MLTLLTLVACAPPAVLDTADTAALWEDAAPNESLPAARGARRAMAAATDPRCTFYLDTGFSGASYTTWSGYDLNDLSSLGLDDNIRSVRCTGGGAVRLYDGRHFTGATTDWIVRDRDLALSRGFADRASSVVFGW